MFIRSCEKLTLLVPGSYLTCQAPHSVTKPEVMPVTLTSPLTGTLGVKAMIQVVVAVVWVNPGEPMDTLWKSALELSAQASPGFAQGHQGESFLASWI